MGRGGSISNIKDKDVTKFVWKNIICWFGISQAIIADKGLQFDSVAFRTFCSELKIKKIILHATIPSEQWASRGNEQNPAIRVEEKIGESQRKMGGRVTRRLMSLLDNTWTTNEKHSFHHHIRDRSSHPHRNRHALSPNRRTGSKGRRSRTCKTPGLGERSERKCIHPNGLLLTKGCCLL